MGQIWREQKEGTMWVASGPSSGNAHQTSKRGCPMGSWMYRGRIWWEHWGEIFNLDVNWQINGLKPGNWMRSPRGCEQIWEGQSPDLQQNQSRGWGVMGEDPGKEQQVKWEQGDWRGRCPGRGGRIPGGGCGPFCRHRQSRPQDSTRCSWSELKHTQGSPQQLQESGGDENHSRGLAHTSCFIYFID